MDNDVLLNKLESLRRCVARIEQKTPETLAELVDDIDLQDIIVLNLERAVQVCVDIGLHVISDLEVSVPDSMSATFRCLAKANVISDEIAQQMAKAVGFRNTAVHAYQAINWAIVYTIINRSLDDFRNFSRQILTFIDSYS